MKQLMIFLMLSIAMIMTAQYVAAQPSISINTIGGFESGLPSYWKMGNSPGGTSLVWATDESRSFGRSLKIDKPSVTADSASWISENMCDLW